MRNSFLLIGILIVFSQSVWAQTRPSSTVSTSVGGICGGCSVQNANRAWDTDAASFATLAVNLAGVGGTAQATYQFTDPVPQYNTLKLLLRFSGGGLLSGIANTEVFQRVRIDLINSTGTLLATYNSTNPAQLDVVSATDNLFEVTVLNPNPATQRIRVVAGDLLSVGLASRDLYVYDIRHSENIVLPALTAEASGKVNGTLCVGCTVTNRDNATITSDPNSDYAGFNVPLSINLGTGYLYSRYNWGGSSYSGSDYDVYLALQNDQIASLGTELLFFQNGNVSAEITYSDGTKEVFKAGNSLVSADVLGVGSGRFYMKIDANDSKSISKVEVRFGGNLIDAASGMRLYNVTVAPSNANPFLEPDIEAVYTVAATKPANEYANNDVLANATDGNGLIVTAGVTTGTLPAGTAIASNGSITVTNAAALVPGTYTVQITTSDVRGGTTPNSVTLTLGPLDTEAVYTVNAAKPRNDYTTNAVLASVTDANGPITSATLIASTLPPGTSLASDGTLTVSNAAALVVNTYPLQILTTDNTGGTTVSNVSIVINANDTEAVYTVNAPKPSTDYTNGAVLATVTDSNGAIVNAAATSGNLPVGTALAADGTITVSAYTALVPGTYTVQITTTDAKGGTTASNVSLVLGPADSEAVYAVNPAKPRNDYSNNAILASAADANGTITAASLTSGVLPLGTTLAADGTIRVANTALLAAGTYPVQITTTDNLGGTTQSSITLILNPNDIEATYAVSPSKPANDYAADATLATVTDANGSVVAATLASGTLPAGATLMTDGTVKVSNPASLNAGTYNVQIITTDDKGGQSTTSIALVIGTADIEAVYTVAASKPVNDYTIGTVLAAATDADGTIISATSSSLPAGTVLDANGTLRVALPAALAAGTYPVQITTTDNKGGTTVSNLSIVINPTDAEAVYTVAPAKPANDYTINATLATATDANGPIVAAAVTTGTLPAGTTLASDGKITVSNPAGLVSGIYIVQITTTDDKGGHSLSTVTLSLNPADIEAIYTVNPAKPVNDYLTNSVLAIATDANGAITSATVTSGALPAGTALAANGTITVNNTAALAAGTYTVQVTTTDTNGGTTATNLVLEIRGNDIEAIYAVNPAKPANDYTANAVLATASDGNGSITSATVTTGILPLGTVLQTDGSITVSNPALLIPGIYAIQITTTDNLGGTTAANVSIVINPIDIEAIYIVNAAKPVNEYTTNETIATVTDLNGPIVNATVTSGALPAGVSLNTDGTLRIANPASLTAGTYTFQVTTTDSNGGTSAVNLSITFNTGDAEAVYTLAPVKPVSDYTPGETIASATDADGAIISAVLTSGVLPAGVTLAANGTIAATVPATMLAGTYAVQVRTTDVKGGTTTSNIAIVLGPADQEATYLVTPPKIITAYVNNDILASATDADGTITAATVTTGTLPAGTTLAANGTIRVSNAAALVAGTYALQITTTDNKGGTTLSTLALIIDPLGFVDLAAVYTIPTPKPVNDLVNGDILAAAVDANGLITAASVTSGTLSPGMVLNPDGTILVNNATLLTAGVYNVQITTTDALGGTTASNVSIVINSTDIEAVYTVPPAKPVNDYTNGAVLASVTDANGAIILSLITSGLLPPGTVIAPNGNITVANTAFLVPGTYPLQIITTDAKLGISISNITITINPPDIEAVYTVNPAKPVNDYINGNVLATATDANGPIVSAAVTSGSLPAGTSLAADGTITVTTASSLVAGTYPVQITTTDNKNGTTASNLNILINATDIEAVYTVNPAKPVNDYTDGAMLATATDANGPIVSAGVTSGTLPPGTALAADGKVTVSSASALVAGTYTVQIATTDNKGGSTTSTVTLIIHPADIEAVYAIKPARPVNDYLNADVLAAVTDANGAITAASVTSGSLPAGTILAPDGTITVSNRTLLMAGAYTVQITTTDSQGGTTTTNLSLTINATDVEAVYTLAPGKPVNDYAAGNVLASATDVNGPIVDAAIASGTLPAGTSLDPDGTIKITDPASLVAGTYAVQITTTDSQGGTTTSSLSIKLNPADIEAVYIVNAARPVNDYTAAAILATVTDANGAITTAVVTTGPLPAGTTLAANGTITVTTPASLIAGTYPLQITTTDANGGTTTSSITLRLNAADVEAAYTIAPAKPVNEYTANTVLASTTDANGPIVATTVSSGTLPPATALDADGTIKVVNPIALVAGIYTLQVITTDSNGGTTTTTLSIKLNTSDIEAVYTVVPPKPANDYTNGAVLASATDANGPIVTTTVAAGTLPPGTALAANGAITVSDAAALAAGTYSVQVTTTDSNGGTTTTSLTLVINPADAEAVYAVVPARPVTEYTNGFSLATAADPNGIIISASVTTGPLPSGVTLAADGTLTVFNSAALVAGSYPVQITTTDENGGSTVSSITIVLNAADIEAVYTIQSARPANEYLANAELASATDANGPIVAAVLTTGTLPPGMTLAANGTLTASNPALLQPGTYTLQITTTDDKGGTTNTILSVVIGPNDIDAVYTIAPPKTVTAYQTGEALATATDANGPIVSAVVSSGNLPPGATLTSDGTVTTNNPAALAPGTYTATITTTDALGGTSSTTVTIVIPNTNITVGVAKAAGLPQLQADGSYTVRYTLTVENFGNTTINTLQVTDNLSVAFPAPATFTVLPGTVATGTLAINPAFNGSSDMNLLNTGSRLDAGSIATILFSVQVQLNGSAGVFNNTATIIAASDDGTLNYTDVSDDGNNPDPSGNGNPSEAGENDPTVVRVQTTPVVGLAKTASTPALKPDGSYDIQYVLTLENLGNENLTNLSVTDNLTQAFPLPATYTVQGNVVASGTLLASTVYDGNSNTNLLAAGSTLAVGDIQTITFKVNIKTNGANIPYYNRASVTAQGATSSYTDASTNGTDPDPNGNRNPSDAGEDQPTGIALTPNLVAGVAKTATIVQPQTDGSFRVTYSVTVKNLGNSNINTLQVTDNLGVAFPSPATYAVVERIATGTLAINPAFDGQSDVNLLAAGSRIAVGATHTILYTVVVKTNAGPNTFYNTAILTAESDDGNTSFVDTSHDGTNPDPNGNGDPTEPSENDPTVVKLNAYASAGAAMTASIPLQQGDGSFLVTYTVTVKNFGFVTLNDVQITDDLVAAFPAPSAFTVTQIATNGTLVVNPAFNGSTERNLLAPGNTLAIGTQQQFNFTVRVLPNDVNGLFYNSAYATATGAGAAGITSDISTAGYNPDPNGNGNPSDIGEDVYTTVTFKLMPVIGLAKTASAPLRQPDDTYNVTFTFTVENLGNTTLTGIAVLDNLALMFPPEVSFHVVSAPAVTGSLVPHLGFNGTNNLALVDFATSTLPVGAKETITFTINVTPDTNIGPFYNSAVAFASNPEGTLTYSDISTNGTDPDPNGNGSPNDANESTFTPVRFAPIPAFGVANDVSDPILTENNTYIVDFSIVVQNLGNEPLDQLKIVNDLRRTFPAPMTIELLTLPTEANGMPLNKAYNGDSDKALVNGGSLEIGESRTITYSVRITPNNTFGTYWNQTTGSAVGRTSGTMAWDLSQDGTDPDLNDDGQADDAGENRPSAVTFFSGSKIILEKTVAQPVLQENCTYNATYTFIITNNGNATLNDIQITDDLAAAIEAPATFSVTSLLGDFGTNDGYDGMNDLRMLAGRNSLAPGTSAQITLTLNIVPNGLYGPFNNTATLTAASPESTIEVKSGNARSASGEIMPETPTVLNIVPRDVFIPEGFSPNGDGVHDILEVTLTCGLTTRLSIFNRWGDLVFREDNYQNTWDGYSNQGSFMGKALPDGTYYYTAEISNGTKLTNFLTLKR